MVFFERAFHWIFIDLPVLSYCKTSSLKGKFDRVLSFSLNLPPGAQFVQQRLVPVGVPTQRLFPAPAPAGLTNALRIAQPPNALNPVVNNDLLMGTTQRLLTAVPGAATQLQQQPQQQPQQHNSSGNTKSSSGSGKRREPLSEEDFYKWQMKLQLR